MVKGIVNWPKENENKQLPTVECLEIENYGGNEQMRFIPVDFPFFEQVRIRVKDIELNGSEGDKLINNYGKNLAAKKWGKLEDAGWKKVFENKKDQSSENEPSSSKYDMIFIRGLHPCFWLEFTS